MTEKNNKLENHYSPEAYELVFDALAVTSKLIKKGKIKPSAPYADDRASGDKEERYHISGQELLEGFKIYVKEQYGDMALLLLERWGLHTTEDVGNIVFEMVKKGQMGKRESDSIEDFKDGYDFKKAFKNSSTLEG